MIYVCCSFSDYQLYVCCSFSDCQLLTFVALPLWEMKVDPLMPLPLFWFHHLNIAAAKVLSSGLGVKLSGEGQASNVEKGLEFSQSPTHAHSISSFTSQRHVAWQCKNCSLHDLVVSSIKFIVFHIFFGGS